MFGVEIPLHHIKYNFTGAETSFDAVEDIDSMPSQTHTKSTRKNTELYHKNMHQMISILASLVVTVVTLLNHLSTTIYHV